MFNDCIVSRLAENGFYILYIRKIKRNDVTPKFAVYRTAAFDGGLVGEYRTSRQARAAFDKATAQAIQYAKEISHAI